MSDTNAVSEALRPRAGRSNRLLWVAGLLALGALYLYASWPKPPAGPSAVEWMHDLAAGKARAAQNNQPVLIDFYATWCGPCQLMDRDVFPRQDVANALADWVAVKIDIDQHPELAERYRVQAIPTFIALSPAGEVVGMLPGFYPPEEFIKWIKSIE